AEFQGDRPHLRFAGESARHLAVMQRLWAQSVPVVAVFLSGRPMWVNPEINAADVFVAAWLPGSEGGGVADVLFGDHDFVGKLPFSWPRSAIQTANVGDPGYDPLFEYGYGLASAESSALPHLPEDDGLGAARVDSGGVLFGGGAFREPWSLTLHSASAEPADATQGSAVSGGVRAEVVDGRAQEDSRRLAWSGRAPASAAVNRAGAVDWTRESNGALAIEVELRIDAEPSADVFLSMACGENCGAAIDVTAPLRSAPSGEFARLAVPLSCFEARGVDMSRVTTGFALETSGSFATTIASVALGSSAEGRIGCD
ncbi:MAG: putative glycoside hydrolase, partial [Pseudomonadota bacterium]